MKNRNKIEIPNYSKTLWQPHIVDPLTHDVVSEGTRFTSTRANNFEEGIYINRELHKSLYNEILRLRTELEIGNRVPGGNSFFDVGTGEDDDIKGIILQDLGSFSTEYVKGETIKVYNIDDIKIGRYYTILDDENVEFFKVRELDKENKEIYLTEELQNEFKKGAKICTSSIKIDKGFNFGHWSIISVKGEVM